jgi:hypothetical protein
MSFGIEIKNKNNEILVDGINKLPLWHETITVDTSTIGSKTVEFTPINDNPFFLVYFENCTISTGTIYTNSNGEFYGVDFSVIEAGGQAEVYIYTI